MQGVYGQVLQKTREVSESLSSLVDQYFQLFEQYQFLMPFAILLIPAFLWLGVRLVSRVAKTLLRSRQIDLSEKAVDSAAQLFFLLLCQLVLSRVMGLLTSSTQLIESFVCTFLLALVMAGLARFVFDWLLANFHDQFHHFTIKIRKAVDPKFAKIRTYLACFAFLAEFFASYGISSQVLFAVFYLLITFECLKLKEQLTPILGRIVPPRAIERAEEFDSVVLPLLTSLPITFFLLSYALVQKLMLSLTFIGPMRQLAAVIIQRQAQESQQQESECLEISQLPKNLVEEFQEVYNRSFPQSVSSQIDLLREVIKEWREGDTEDYSASIVAPPGCGGEDILQKSLAGLGMKTVRWNIEGRITNPSQVKEGLREALGVEDLLNRLKAQEEPLVLVISGAHRLFLNQHNGFKAYATLADIFNVASSNVFWILTYDYQAWCFLRSFYQQNLVFRRSFLFSGLGEDELKELVLGKLENLGLKLVFEKSFYQLTAKKGSESRAENVQTHYFRILREQAHGNPGLAMELLLESMTEVTETQIKVRLPESPSVDSEDLQPALMFVLGQLFRHGSLTFDEIRKVTSYSFRPILIALRVAVDHKMLEKDEKGAYSICLPWYFPLKKYMMSRNYIYE